MAVQVYWENSQHTAVVLKFTAPWSWADYEVVGAELEAMVNSVSHTVDVLINITDAGAIPADGMFRMRELYTQTLPNLGEYVFIGAPEGFKSLMNVADRYYTALGGELDYRIA